MWWVLLKGGTSIMVPRDHECRLDQLVLKHGGSLRGGVVVRGGLVVLVGVVWRFRHTVGS